MIPYSKQEITQQDIDAVVETLKSDFLTQGPKILEFEEKFAKFVGSKYAIAVSNGTAGLHLAAKALNVSKGDKVVTTPITFAASGNCIKYCEGDIIFCDIDEDSYIIDIEKLKLILENDVDLKIKGIVVVNFAGYVQNLQDIRKIANRHNLWIIEDACHSVGGYFIDSDGNKQYSGSCKFSDVSVFSFHPVKHICCGEGGMITTNNEDIYKKILKYRTHGITKDKKEFLNDVCLSGGDEEHPDWYMEMQDLGFNYRMTDIQATLGISQLSRIDSNLERRKEIVKKYENFFNENKFAIRYTKFMNSHAYHLYVIEVDNRLELYNFLRKNGIYCQIHYIPLHLMPYYQSIEKVGLPVAENYYKGCISLPLYHTLTDEQLILIFDKIKQFYEK